MNQNSEIPMINFFRKEQGNINKPQQNHHENNLFVFKNDISEDNKTLINKKHCNDNINSKYSISNNSIKQSKSII